MAKSEILLLQPIDKLGHEGERVEVRAGYARNFLLPRKMAIPYTKANKKQIDALQKARDVRLQKELEGAQSLRERIETYRIAIAVKTGPGGKLFGSVTAMDLHKRIADEGVEIDRHAIHLDPAKTLGKHSAEIRLHPEVKFDFEFEVVSENPIDEIEGEESSEAGTAAAASN